MEKSFLIQKSPTCTYSISEFLEIKLSDLTAPLTNLPDLDKVLHTDCPTNPEAPVTKIFFI